MDVSVNDGRNTASEAAVAPPSAPATGDHIGRTTAKIAIMGGGLGGLLAAILLARRGHAVTVVERDEEPPVSGPEHVFARWARRGLPQAHQPHLFLGRSVRVLRDEAPDLLEDLLAAGARRVSVDLGDGPDDAVVCSRRLTYEVVLRRAAERQPGVTFRAGEGVDDLVFERADIPRVTGIRLEGGDVVRADLIVDASGRRSPTPRIVSRHGSDRSRPGRHHTRRACDLLPPRPCRSQHPAIQGRRPSARHGHPRRDARRFLTDNRQLKTRKTGRTDDCWRPRGRCRGMIGAWS
jgi:2-polyprenyl-6-methoxyphenol hydroxylase-like FAD-dependent oxidoreductase